MLWFAHKIVPAGHGCWHRIVLRFDHFPHDRELPPGLWHRYPDEGGDQVGYGEHLSCWGTGPRRERQPAQQTRTSSAADHRESRRARRPRAVADVVIRDATAPLRPHP